MPHVSALEVAPLRDSVEKLLLPRLGKDGRRLALRCMPGIFMEALILDFRLSGALLLPICHVGFASDGCCVPCGSPEGKWCQINE
jgi:hypothetical protein